MQNLLVAAGAVGAAGAVAYYATRPPPPPPCVVPPLAQPPMIGTTDNARALYDSVDVANPSANPNRVFFPPQWHLAQPDSGAFRFRVQAPAGSSLVVYLVDKPDANTLHDSNGYAVVFDQRRLPKSFVAAIPGFPTPHPQSRANREFRFGGTEEPQAFWVVYEQGSVYIGHGERVGEGLITCLRQQQNGPVPTNIQYFGFGALCKQDVSVQVTDIRTFDAPAGDCAWKDLVPGGGGCDALPSAVVVGKSLAGDFSGHQRCA